MKLSLAEAAVALGVNLDKHADIYFDGVSIDSRTTKPGNIFIAFKGTQSDGHQYIKAAQDKGAVAAIVNVKNSAIDLPQIQCTDSLKALWNLAKLARSKYQGKVIAITGSTSKTTTKELIRAVLASKFTIHATSGNYNNHLGLPITLLDLQPEHQIAVIEIGTNSPGEIATLAQLAQPHLAVITNIGPAHLEKLGDLVGVTQEKTALLKYLPLDGVAFLNGDDEHLIPYQQSHWITFGYNNNNDYRLAGFKQQDLEHITFSINDTKFQMHGLGKGLTYGAAVAYAIADKLGIAKEEIQTAISNFNNVSGRMTVHHLKDEIIMIDDSYNANPMSAELAIETLLSLPDSHRKILVLGDMLELGTDSLNYHQSVADKAKLINHVYLFGEQYNKINIYPNYQSFLNLDYLINELKSILQPKDIILIKGSHYTGLYRAAQALKEHYR